MPDPQNKLERVLLNRMTPSEQLYRDVVNVPLKGASRGVDSEGNELPPVADAPPFRPAPIVASVDKDFLKAVERLLRIAPELRGQMPQITQGHTNASIRDHVRSNLPPDAFGSSTLMGIYDRINKHIGIDPTLKSNRPLPPKGQEWTKDDLDSVLAHEAAHAAGYGKEAAADPLGLLMTTDKQLAPRNAEVLGNSQKLLEVLTKYGVKR